MKLLKIFGIVASIHVVALVLIFANPGCSTSSERATPSDTIIDTGSDAVVSVPNLSPGNRPRQANDSASIQINAFDTPSPISNSLLQFNPDAVAVSGDGRYSPSRPNTPVAKALKAEPVNNVVPVTTYTVVRGDSLWSIAKRNGLSVADLSSSNNLRASATLQLGQKLIIPGKAISAMNEVKPTVSVAVKSKPAPTPPQKKNSFAVTSKPAPTSNKNRDSFTHVVKSGETLGGIARKYQVRIGTIATANNISDPAKIRPGQSLEIPGWTAPVVTKPKPVKATPAPTPVQAVDKPIEMVNSPFIFTPPPADRPLDEGFMADPGDAPVIQVEETDGPQS